MLTDYIKENYKNTIRENKEDCGNLLGLPYPYTVPCVSNAFQEMYYWDTYFTNVGLIKSGYEEQALNNINNILYMIDKFGYMPNGNRTFYLKNSQPPFASMMVRDVYKITKDKEWLKDATGTLIKEHKFWTEKRITPIFLSQYGINENAEDRDYMADLLVERLGFEPPIDSRELRIVHCTATGESGWDLTPRFEFEAFNYTQIDLNSLLYKLEDNISFFFNEIGEKENSDIWKEKAETRAEIMRKYMLNEKGIFFDYNFDKKYLSPVFSAASYYPLFVGLATEDEAKSAVDNLPLLEAEHGVVMCAQTDIPGNYQWGYPNGWAPLQFVIIKGLLNYGYTLEAKRIAKKYTNIVESNFEKTHNLWEKYNVVDGSINTVEEYETPPMIGWTAGVYLFCKELLK